MTDFDLTQELLLPLAAVARQLPRGRSGRAVHPSTLFRWARAGLRGVRLEVLKVGGRTFTSLAAVQRFSDRLTTVRYGSPQSPAPAKNVDLDGRLERDGW